MEPSLYEQQAKKPVSQHSASPAFNRNTENRQAIFLGFVSIFFFNTQKGLWAIISPTNNKSRGIIWSVVNFLEEWERHGILRGTLARARHSCTRYIYY